MSRLSHRNVVIASLAVALLAGAENPVTAQQAPPTYGAPISLEAAKRILAAAEAEATRNMWTMAIAIIDSTGHLTAFAKQDGTQHGSVGYAQVKATSAVNYKRSTKVFEDAVTQGGAGVRILGLPGSTAIEGGLPMVVNGTIVGAIGVSGGSSVEDGIVARAGLDSFR